MASEIRPTVYAKSKPGLDFHGATRATASRHRIFGYRLTIYPLLPLPVASNPEEKDRKKDCNRHSQQEENQ